MEQQDQAVTSESQAEATPPTRISTTLAKWACASPTIAALFAIATERIFFGGNDIWQMLRGTGDGGQ
jgi:hypothetical protein